MLPVEDAASQLVSHLIAADKFLYVPCCLSSSLQDGADSEPCDEAASKSLDFTSCLSVHQAGLLLLHFPENLELVFEVELGDVFLREAEVADHHLLEIALVALAQKVYFCLFGCNGCLEDLQLGNCHGVIPVHSTNGHLGRQLAAQAVARSSIWPGLQNDFLLGATDLGGRVQSAASDRLPFLWKQRLRAGIVQ